jgi:hypothetical protein
MRLDSLKTVFEKLERYQNRRFLLSKKEFVSKIEYTLTCEQFLEIEKKNLTPEQYFAYHKGQRIGTNFADMETSCEPITLEEIHDLAEDFAKTIWDCKERIQRLASRVGVSKKSNWEEVKTHRELCIIADLANTIKHDGLYSKPLSGIKPIINGVRNSSKGKGNSFYTREDRIITAWHPVGDFEVFASIRDLENPQFELGEVFSVGEKAIEQWQIIIDKFNLSEGIHSLSNQG